MEKENPQQQALNYYCMKLRIKMPSMESIYVIIRFHIAEDKSRMPLKLRTRVHQILTY